MFTKIIRITMIAMMLAGVLVPTLASAAGSEKYSQEMQSAIDQLKTYTDNQAKADKNLKTFDTLDFVVFSGQQWLRLHESHSKDIIVHWPDGHQTVGIDKHIEDLKAMFVYAPDTMIKFHPVKVGSGDFTAVTGIMTGTFSKPMPIGNGKFIQPTGKKFNITMCTVGHWKDGVMIEEWLFWDNLTFMKQIGLM